MPELRSGSTTLAPSDLVYAWKQNYSADQNDSGYGKSSLTATSSYLDQSEHVDVAISSRDGSVSTAASADVAPVKPQIVWYEESPVYGPRYENALDTDFSVTGSDTSILAQPYFFSPLDPSSPKLQYSWTLNGNAVDTPNIPDTLFLHRDTTDKGTANLSVSLSNVTTLFQEATASLTLHLQ